MTERNLFYKKINHLVIGAYIFVCVGLIIYKLEQKDFYPITQCALALGLLLVPKVIEKVWKIKEIEDFKLIYYIFCFLSVIGGSALLWYAYIPGWDKILHFSSGFLMAMGGLVVYTIVKKESFEGLKKERLLLGIFLICFTMALAVLWEFYEYGLYVFLNIDALNVETTGIHDTLQDMLVCTVGGILMTFSIQRGLAGKKLGYFLKCYEHFCQVNIKKDK